MFAKNLKKVLLVGAALSLTLSMISCGKKEEKKPADDATKTEAPAKEDEKMDDTATEPEEKMENQEEQSEMEQEKK